MSWNTSTAEMGYALLRPAGLGCCRYIIVLILNLLRWVWLCGGPPCTLRMKCHVKPCSNCRTKDARGARRLNRRVLCGAANLSRLRDRTAPLGPCPCVLTAVVQQNFNLSDIMKIASKYNMIL